MASVEPSSITYQKGAGWYSRSLESQVASGGLLERPHSSGRFWPPSIDAPTPTVIYTNSRRWDRAARASTRDGGVNGVKLTWSECETQYEVERGVECYERQKSHPDVAAWNPLSVGIAYAMIDRIRQDKVPLITVNHGRTDSTDGRVFPYVFPLLLNPYSETSGIINYISSKLGSPEALKGKKIVVLTARPMKGNDPDLRTAVEEIRLRGATDRGFQIIQVAVDTGIAQAALDETVRFGRTKEPGVDR